MLQKIINHNSPGFGSSLLLVDDKSTAQSGARLLQNLISSLQGNCDHVLLHDGVSLTDPIIKKGLCKMATLCSFDCEEIRHWFDQSSANSVMVINCVSTITFLHGVSEVARLLRHIRDLSYDVKLIGLVHKDVLNSEVTVNNLSFLFDTVIELEPYSSKDAHFDCLVSCLKREPSGKIISSREAITWDAAGLLVSQAVITTATITDSGDGSTKVIEKLTFNLNLSDNEKQARNALQLPYLKKDSEKNVLLSKTAKSSGKPAVSITAEMSQASLNPPTGGGKIYYQYDDADNFDEEDPDDDLDI